MRGRSTEARLLDRPDPPTTTPIAPLSEAAQRRVFRSKVDTIRPTYGFEDVCARPGHEHDRAGRRRPRPVVLRDRAGDPDPRLGDGRGRRRAVRRRAGAPRRPGGPQPRRRPGPLRRPGRGPRADRRRARPTQVQDLLAEAYAAADPRGAHRAPDRGDPRRRLAGRRRRDAGRRPAVRAVLRRARRGPVPRPEPGQQRPPPRDAATTRCRSTEFTRFMPIPVAVGNTTNAEAAFALMEQGAAAVFVGVGPGRGLHDPRGARDRRPAGHRDQRRRRGTRRLPRRDRPLRPGRRRRRDAPRRRAGQGDRRRRRRAHARLAAGARRGGARAGARTGAWPRRRRRCRAGTRIRSGPAGTPRADPVRAGARDRRLGEPRRRAPPVDGRARGAARSARCRRSRWSTRPSVQTEGKSWQRSR